MGRSVGDRRAGALEVTPGHYDDWRERAQSFEEMTLIEPVSVEPDRRRRRARAARGLRTTPNLFATIGLAPLLGRTFEPDEGAGRGRRRQRSDSGCAASAATPRPSAARSRSTARAHVVVGVVPRDFRFPVQRAGRLHRHGFLAGGPRRARHVLVVRRREAACRRLARGGARRDARHLPRRSKPRAPATGRGAAVAVVPLRDDLARGPSLRRSWRCSARSRSCC